MSGLLADGHGNEWSRCDRADCGLEIVRPGKVQCRCDGDDARVLILRAEDGDWTAAYRGGDLLAQGHRLEPERLLEALGIEHDSLEVPCPDPGKFPAHWDHP